MDQFSSLACYKALEEGKLDFNNHFANTNTSCSEISSVYKDDSLFAFIKFP